MGYLDTSKQKGPKKSKTEHTSSCYKTATEKGNSKDKSSFDTVNTNLYFNLLKEANEAADKKRKESEGKRDAENRMRHEQMIQTILSLNMPR